jgi:phage protein D
MEQLATLARTYGDFYAPAYAVRLGGADVMRELLIPISQVEVDLTLGTASRFSFTVTDCYDQALQRFRTGSGGDVLRLLTFGAEIEIGLGYGNANLPVMASGMISEIGTSFPEGGSPELTISGFDHGFMLTLGRSSRTWKDALDSDAVHEIASFNNLGDAIETTKVKHAQIEQNNQSDWQFLVQKLAKRNDEFEVYVDEQRKLHFARRNDKATAVVELVYGEGLLSFKPEANLAGQVSRVELFGWHPGTKKPIVGRASAGEEAALSGKSGGEFLNAFVRDSLKRPTLRIRQPVFTQAEADQRARAVLNDNAKKFLTGEGEAIGLPELRPDRNVQLSRLGPFFSKTYYIETATHKIDTNGYRTRFKVKESGL